MKIIYSPTFIKKYKKLPTEIKKLAEEKEILFRKDPFDLQLKTHKLHGKFKKYYSFTINYQYRIIFEKQEENYYFHFIGKHNIYK